MINRPKLGSVMALALFAIGATACTPEHIPIFYDTYDSPAAEAALA